MDQFFESIFETMFQRASVSCCTCFSNEVRLRFLATNKIGFVERTVVFLELRLLPFFDCFVVGCFHVACSIEILIDFEDETSNCLVFVCVSGMGEQRGVPGGTKEGLKGGGLCIRG